MEVGIADEISLYREAFDYYDPKKTGKISLNNLALFLDKVGKNTDAQRSISETASKYSYALSRDISFQDIILLIRQHDKSLMDLPSEKPDTKVIEFLKILEEYRLKCEDEGNYLEASRANKQLDLLRTQEEKRQQKAIKTRQYMERTDILAAHSMQYHEFNRAWDIYLEEFDSMAMKYVQQMTERHAKLLIDFQEKLREELSKKPPKWSKELMEQRRQQSVNAKSRNYAEAQRLKMLCDRMEEKERVEIEQNVSINFTRREALFRQQQQVEVQALLKRIECRRKEHIKQRNADSKRLLQRNKNVQAVLESKQSIETQRLFEEIKKSLNMNTILNLSSHGKLPHINNSNNTQDDTDLNTSKGFPESYEYQYRKEVDTEDFDRSEGKSSNDHYMKDVDSKSFGFQGLRDSIDNLSGFEDDHKNQISNDSSLPNPQFLLAKGPNFHLGDS